MPNRHDARQPQADRRHHAELTTEDLEREIEQLAGQFIALEKQMPSADEIKHWRAMAEADKRRAWLITLTLKASATVTAIIVIWTAGLDALRNLAVIQAAAVLNAALAGVTSPAVSDHPRSYGI